MNAVTKPIIAIVLTHKVGIDDYCYPMLKALVESFEPNYWEFQPPDTMSVYFFNSPGCYFPPLRLHV